MRLSKEEGTYLVKLARRAVEEYLVNLVRIPPPADAPKALREKRGVFVTIETIVERPGGEWGRELRGCIGYPEPVKPLVEAVIDSAIAAATEDPRFPPMRAEELKDVIFEVSVLTPLQEVKYQDPSELPEKIVVGKHGIVIERGFLKGLLLPQVAIEYGWSSKEFLSQACVKAGLPPDAWLYGGVKVYVFEAQIFAELAPNGEVIERILLPGGWDE